MSRISKIFLSFSIPVFLLTAFFSVEAKESISPRAGWSFQTLGEIPIQGGGRVKPFDSFAREAVLHITGSSHFESWDTTETVLSWIAFPEEWHSVAFIRVGHPDVRKQFLLEASQSRFTPAQLLGSASVFQYAQGLGPEGSQKQSVAPQPKADPRDQELRRVYDRIVLFRMIQAGEAIKPIPNKDPNDVWQDLTMDSEGARPLLKLWFAVINSYREGKQDQFNESSKALLMASNEYMAKTWGPDLTAHETKKLSAEKIYNRYRPFTLAMLIYFLSAFVFLFGKRSKKFTQVGLALSIVAFLIHIFGFVLRMIVAERPPVSNMYESVVWVSFGAVLFSLILYSIYKRSVLVGSAGVLAGLGLLAASVSPTILDPGLHPLVPVLRSNYWLTVHVLTITLGYAAFALALGISNVTLWNYLKNAPLASIEALNQLAYRAVQFGVVLLAAGTILGGVWADASWGRFWGWDPKEVWALIALLCYLAILHARFVGWVGTYGFAALCVAAFLSVVMAWYGVNFVLGAGLHSYGFGGGGLSGVTAFCALQLAFVAWVSSRRKSRSA